MKGFYIHVYPFYREDVYMFITLLEMIFTVLYYET